MVLQSPNSEALVDMLLITCRDVVNNESVRRLGTVRP